MPKESTTYVFNALHDLLLVEHSHAVQRGHSLAQFVVADVQGIFHSSVYLSERVERLPEDMESEAKSFRVFDV